MEIDDYKRVNITRTQSWIIKSLLNLLNEFPYEVITITEICQDADVSRVTFYRYFDTKEAVLLLYIRLLVNNHFEEMKTFDKIDFRIIARSYFEYWLRERDFLILLQQNNLQRLILEEHWFAEKKLNDLLLTNPHYKELSLSEIEILYRRSFNFSGLWRVVFIWVERNFSESIEEMSEILTKIKSSGMM